MLRNLIEWVRDRLAGGGEAPSGAPGGRRPVPGEIWYAQVPYEDGWGSKDRPCLVLEVRKNRVSVAKITSADQSRRAEYEPFSTRGWYRGDKTSWIQTDTAIKVPVRNFRRMAGSCPPEEWQRIQKSRAWKKR